MEISSFSSALTSCRRRRTAAARWRAGRRRAGRRRSRHDRCPASTLPSGPAGADMHRAQRQRIAAAFIAEAQAQALAGDRHPHQLADGDVGGSVSCRHHRHIAGIVQQRRSGRRGAGCAGRRRPAASPWRSRHRWAWHAGRQAAWGQSPRRRSRSLWRGRLGRRPSAARISAAAPGKMTNSHVPLPDLCWLATTFPWAPEAAQAGLKGGQKRPKCIAHGPKPSHAKPKKSDFSDASR